MRGRPNAEIRARRTACLRRSSACVGTARAVVSHVERTSALALPGARTYEAVMSYHRQVRFYYAW